MSAGPVVPETSVLDEQAFQERVVAGFSRCIVAVGKPRFALDLGMTVRGLDKVLAGSTPKAHSLLNVRARHPTALDELLAGYGARIVPAGAVVSTDAQAGLPLLRAAHKCIEAEADGRTDHQELLAMEPELRAAAALVAGLIARIDALKGVGR